MKALLRKLRSRFLAGVARQEDLDRLYDQVSGLLQIQTFMGGKQVLRPLRGWAMSPDALAWILADLQERTEPSVIEFGSGQSTVILASALKHKRGKLLTVEHDTQYSAVIERQVAACGLSELVQFFHAPVRQMADEPPHRSYDLTALPAAQFDVALIDGPPVAYGLLSRLTPLRWAAEHLKAGGVIFLDDSAREPEQECLKRLAAEHPGLRQVARSAEKGLVELQKGME